MKINYDSHARGENKWLATTHGGVHAGIGATPLDAAAELCAVLENRVYELEQEQKQNLLQKLKTDVENR